MPKPKKSLGQNFLSDPNYRRKIVTALDPQPHDRILEIGPGMGAITNLVAGLSAELVLVEKDKALAGELAMRLDGKAKVINDDFLDVKLEDILDPTTTYKAVGNLPYNAAAPILIRLLENHQRFSDLFLMFQKEVALRFVAKPETKDYGLPTLWATIYSECKILFHLPPTVFFPQPKVHSSFVHFKMRKEPLIRDEDARHFWHVARTLFQHRRKTMASTLKEAGWEPSVIEALELKPHARVEALSVDGVLNLVAKLRRDPPSV